MPALLAVDPRATVAAIAMLMVFGLLGLASVVVVARAAERLRRGEVVVPWSWRRPAPWGATEVVLLLAFYFFFPGVLLSLATDVFGVSVGAPAASRPLGAPARELHPIGRLLAETTNPWLLLLAALTAVVVAPVVEEFLFRVVVQGWLESLDWRLWRRHRFGPPRGVLPIVLSSLFFAMLHVRRVGVEMPLERIALQLAVQAVAGVSLVVFGPLVLRYLAGAEAADLGWAPRRFGEDVRLGLWGWLGATAPVYLAFALAKTVVPADWAADPVPLLPLAIVLGTIYYRTHRIVGPIVLHAAFNLTGLILALLGTWGSGAAPP